MGLERQAGLNIEESKIPSLVLGCGIGKLGKALNVLSVSENSFCDNEEQRGTRRKSVGNEIEVVQKEMLVWRVSFR